METKILPNVSLSIALMFLLIVGSKLTYAKDSQPSPLFEESLEETLDEFISGTRAIRRNKATEKSPANEDKNIGAQPQSLDKTSSQQEEKFINTQGVERSTMRKGLWAQPQFLRPTFSGSSTCWKSETCRSIKCISLPRLPTLIGTTCETTCGLRSTCAGCICRFISPCAQADNPERVAENKEKTYTLNLF